MRSRLLGPGSKVAGCDDLRLIHHLLHCFNRTTVHPNTFTPSCALCIAYMHLEIGQNRVAIIKLRGDILL